LFERLYYFRIFSYCSSLGGGGGGGGIRLNVFDGFDFIFPGFDILAGGGGGGSSSAIVILTLGGGGGGGFFLVCA
jgi:hypothetical protein